MKKRIRKKRHMKEFQEMGFNVKITPTEETTGELVEKLFWDFIEHAIEANGLLAGGGYGGSIELFVGSIEGHGSATEAHRAAVTEWLKGDPRVVSYEVGELEDAWY